MATKKIPISFNDYDQDKLKELIDLMGITDVYGDIPKAVKFSINLAISALKNPEKVYSDINASDLDIFFKSRFLIELDNQVEKNVENIRKSAKKYNSKP